MRDDRGEIGHRARWDEKRIFLAGQFTSQGFELQHSRIVPAGRVAEARRRDGRHHLRRRQGDGVAAEIVDVHLVTIAEEDGCDPKSPATVKKSKRYSVLK